MTESPLAYFGNRGQFQVDIAGMLMHGRHHRKYDCCYDLFSGSGSITLFAMSMGIANRYVMNDTFALLYYFWVDVRDQPDKLIREYNDLLTKYLACEGAARVSFYEELKTGINVDQSGQSAIFAFIINHAKLGIPLITIKDGKSTLNSELTSTKGQTTIDGCFASHVMAVNALFAENDVTFGYTDFKDYQKSIHANDCVILDPPFPDMPDACQHPDGHVYPRVHSKHVLRDALDSFVHELDKNDTSYVMFYGVLGMDNAYPISRLQGHALRLSFLTTESGDRYEYVENVYLSKKLTPYLLDAANLGLFQPLFHKIFETHAQKDLFNNNVKTALVWEEDNEIRKATYEEVNAVANRLARLLLKSGFENDLNSLRKQKSNEEPLIAICLERAPPLYISILAVMKTGAAYLPLDAYPAALDRQACYERVKSSGSKVLITTTDIKKYFLEHHPDLALTIFAIEKIDYMCTKLTREISNASNIDSPIKHNDLAYVMYTSGSTGAPKGVEVLHRGLPFAFTSHHDLLNLSCRDRIAQFASIGFDASLMEIMLAWGAGAELHIVGKLQYDDSRELAHFLNRRKITIALQTPRKLETLDPRNINSLRAVLIIGDKFPKSLSDAWLTNIASFSGETSERKVINGYGLTETTICASLSLCAIDKPLTAGEPILGNDLEVVNSGDYSDVSGELFVSGPCLARGYWKRPDLTRERFSERYKDGALKRYYNTGDIGYRTGNDFVITGRADRQVKIRGQRIELGEIEKTILQLEAVAEARVVAVDCVSDQQGFTNKVLVAFIVCKDPFFVIEGKNPSPPSLKLLNTIRMHLKNSLPASMCPSLSNMTLLKMLPKKENDKVSYDDKQLQAVSLPCITLPATDIDAVDSKTQMLIQWLRKIISDSLNLLPLDIPYHPYTFTDLGGDSISVTRCINMMLKATDKPTEWTLEIDSLLPSEILNASVKDLCVLLAAKKLKTSRLRQIRDTIESNFDNTPNAWLYKLFGVYDGELINKMKIPFYTVHSILGDAHLDYAHSEIGKLNVGVSYLSHDRKIQSQLMLMIHRHVMQVYKKSSISWLLGWSSGGYIAYQIAKQLRLLGDTVYLFIVDSMHPSMIQKEGNRQFAEGLLYIGEKILQALKLATEREKVAMQLPSLDDFCSLTSKHDTVNKFFDLIERQTADFLEKSTTVFTEEQKDKSYNIISSARIIAKAELDETDTMVLGCDDFLYIAERNSANHGSATLGWTFDGPPNIDRIDADHFGILNDSGFMRALSRQVSRQVSCVQLPYLESLSECMSGRDLTSIGGIAIDEQSVQEFYNKEVKHAPAEATKYNDRGIFMLLQGNVKGAMQDFKKVLELNPDDRSIYSNLVILKTKVDYSCYLPSYASCAVWSGDGNGAPYRMLISWSIKLTQFAAANIYLDKFVNRYGISNAMSEERRKTIKISFRNPGMSLDWFDNTFPLPLIFVQLSVPFTQRSSISIIPSQRSYIRVVLDPESKKYFQALTILYSDSIKIVNEVGYLDLRWITRLSMNEAMELAKAMGQEGDNLLYAHKTLIRANRIALFVNRLAGHSDFLPGPLDKPLPAYNAVTASSSPSVMSFFYQSELNAIIKKFKLPDTSQAALEKGLRNATANNFLKDVEIFLKFVKNVDAADTNPSVHKSALHYAAAKGYLEICDLLILKGARLDISDATGKTALAYLKSAISQDVLVLEQKISSMRP